MKPLVVIGLDSCDSHYLVRHPNDLPNLHKLFIRQGHQLTCDVTPIHSGPCWATIFAGDSLGLTDFADHRDPEALQRVARCNTWLWTPPRLYSYVENVPITLPPICIRAPSSGWLETTLSLTKDEMARSTWRIMGNLIVTLRTHEYDLIATVVSSLDRAGHTWGMGHENTLQQYKLVDEQLPLLMGWLREYNWVFLSDHGMTSVRGEGNYANEPRDGRKGWHSRNGVIISNMSDAPNNLSEVYQWLKEALP